MKHSLIALAFLVPAYCYALYSDLTSEQARNIAAMRAAEIALYTPTRTPTRDLTPKTITPTATFTPTQTPTPNP